jgi:1,4-dihydroxy-2-naphthoate octaprenyltransferase
MICHYGSIVETRIKKQSIISYRLINFLEGGLLLMKKDIAKIILIGLICVMAGVVTIFRPLEDIVNT